MSNIMNSRSIQRTAISVLCCAAFSACTNIPLTQPVLVTAPQPQQQNPCLSCAPSAEYSYAITRPLTCNDYPVSYRVRPSETDFSVRNIDHSILVSRERTEYIYQQSPCSGR